MSNKLGFFKIISAPIMESQELGLPPEFVKKHGKDFSDVATLKVPNGTVWKVDMKRVERKLWFTGGWKDFVEQYSISVGHVVFFTYHGSCKFSVVICDMTAVEIKYDSNFENPVAHEPGENSVEEVAMKSEIPRRKCGRHRKSLKVLPRKSVSSPANQHQRPGKGIAHMAPEWNSWAATRQTLSTNQSAIKAAKEYNPQGPSFMVVMQPTYVQDKFALNVPFHFVKEHIGSESQDIYLYVRNEGGLRDEKVWRVSCCIYDTSVKIYGWRDFCQDNNLEVGDVCVFELLEMDTVAFEVSIFRATNG